MTMTSCLRHEQKSIQFIYRKYLFLFTDMLKILKSTKIPFYGSQCTSINRQYRYRNNSRLNVDFRYIVMPDVCSWESILHSHIVNLVDVLSSSKRLYIHLYFVMKTAKTNQIIRQEWQKQQRKKIIVIVIIAS